MGHDMDLLCSLRFTNNKSQSFFANYPLHNCLVYKIEWSD